MRRVFLVAAALAIPASAATVDLSGGIASAIGVTTTCTTMTGSVTGEISWQGCTGGSTGGGSQFVLPTTLLATGGTVSWINGNTTTITAGTLKTSQKLTANASRNTGLAPASETGKARLSPARSARVTLRSQECSRPRVCFDSAGNVHALRPTTIT